MPPAIVIDLYYAGPDLSLPSSVTYGKRIGVIFLAGPRRHRLWKLMLGLCGLWLLHSLSQYFGREQTGHDLRILALGDSITWGYGSTDGNGYRGHLLDDLVGNHALFVGSEMTGDMRNNEHEGHPGGRISATLAAASWGLDERPNIILLHIGSNDLIYHEDPATAPHRFKTLVEQIFILCPDAVILTAKLGPSINTRYTELFVTFNMAIEDVVRAQQNRGHHILLLDIPRDLSATEDLADDLHPNDSGYRKMATAWLAGIRVARQKHWIADPAPLIYSDDIEANEVENDFLEINSGFSAKNVLMQGVDEWLETPSEEEDGHGTYIALSNSIDEEI